MNKKTRRGPSVKKHVGLIDKAVKRKNKILMKVGPTQYTQYGKVEDGQSSAISWKEELGNSATIGAAGGEPLVGDSIIYEYGDSEKSKTIVFTKTYNPEDFKDHNIRATELQSSLSVKEMIDFFKPSVNWGLDVISEYQWMIRELHDSRNLMKQSIDAITVLKKDNELMRARLAVFDQMMNLISKTEPKGYIRDSEGPADLCYQMKGFVEGPNIYKFLNKHKITE